MTCDESEETNMSFHRLMMLAVMFLVTGGLFNAQAQFGKQYQQMTTEERSAFVERQAQRIAREISGNQYNFTPEFRAEIQASLDWYAKRVDAQGKRNLQLVMERGEAHAATLGAAFKARNVSPLIGLYIPLIESEYVNFPSPNMMGAVGMFQFLPQTGANYGLSPQELLDVQKSADAAARYIIDGLKIFGSDPMKETLALLAYNRGANRVEADLKLIEPQDRQCSICALTAAKEKMDTTFREESIYYVPRFFAAAIIGENPRVFGLRNQPLSSY